MQGPDLFLRALPARLALGRALLGRRGRVWSCHGHRDHTVGQRHGLLAQRRIDRVEHLAMRGKNLVQRFRQVLEEMKAVGDLNRRRRPVVCAIGLGFRPMARDHLDPRMPPKPLRQGRRGAIGEECDRLAALEIAEHRAVGLAFPHRQIVYTKDTRACARWDRSPAEHAQEGTTADGYAQDTAELCARCPAQGHGDVRQPVQEAPRPPSPRGHDTGQSLRKDTA